MVLFFRDFDTPSCSDCNCNLALLRTRAIIVSLGFCVGTSLTTLGFGGSSRTQRRLIDLGLRGNGSSGGLAVWGSSNRGYN